MPDPSPLPNVQSVPQTEAKSRFFMRIISWFQSRCKLRRSQSCRHVRVRRKSTEFHTKKVLTTKFADITKSERVKGQVILVSSKPCSAFSKLYMLTTTISLIHKYFHFKEQMAARAVK